MELLALGPGAKLPESWYPDTRYSGTDGCFPNNRVALGRRLQLLC